MWFNSEMGNSLPGAPSLRLCSLILLEEISKQWRGVKARLASIKLRPSECVKGLKGSWKGIDFPSLQFYVVNFQVSSPPKSAWVLSGSSSPFRKLNCTTVIYFLYPCWVMNSLRATVYSWCLQYHTQCLDTAGKFTKEQSDSKWKPSPGANDLGPSLYWEVGRKGNVGRSWSQEKIPRKGKLQRSKVNSIDTMMLLDEVSVEGTVLWQSLCSKIRQCEGHSRLSLLLTTWTWAK